MRAYCRRECTSTLFLASLRPAAEFWSFKYFIGGIIKHITIVFSLLIFACSSQQSKYPNVTTEQLLSDLTWGLDSATVCNILTNNYKLQYLREENQGVPRKVFVFSGGKFNDVETQWWKVLFVHDILFFVQMTVANDDQKQVKQSFKKLCELNDELLEKDSISTLIEHRWYYQKEGKRISNILLSDFTDHNAFPILISRGSW